MDLVSTLQLNKNMNIIVTIAAVLLMLLATWVISIFLFPEDSEDISSEPPPFDDPYGTDGEDEDTK